MYNNKYNNYDVNPTTHFTRWLLQDFVKVLDYEDLDDFLSEFWSSYSGFNVEFDIILKALDCLDCGDDYFVYPVYEHEQRNLVTYNICAAAVVSRERMRSLASAMAFVIDVWKENNIGNVITEYLCVQDNKSDYNIVLNYLKDLFEVKLSDGSIVTKKRILDIRRMLTTHADTNSVYTFTTADKSVLYAALDVLEDKCVF